MTMTVSQDLAQKAFASYPNLRETVAYYAERRRPGQSDRDVAIEALTSYMAVVSLGDLVRGLHECGPLCPEHGDVRDTSVIR